MWQKNVPNAPQTPPLVSFWSFITMAKLTWRKIYRLPWILVLVTLWLYVTTIGKSWKESNLFDSHIKWDPWPPKLNAHTLPYSLFLLNYWTVVMSAQRQAFFFCFFKAEATLYLWDILLLDTLQHRVVNPGMKKMKGVTYQISDQWFQVSKQILFGSMSRCPGRCS